MTAMRSVIHHPLTCAAIARTNFFFAPPAFTPVRLPRCACNDMTVPSRGAERRSNLALEHAGREDLIVGQKRSHLMVQRWPLARPAVRCSNCILFTTYRRAPAADPPQLQRRKIKDTSQSCHGSVIRSTFP